MNKRERFLFNAMTLVPHSENILFFTTTDTMENYRYAIIRRANEELVAVKPRPKGLVRMPKRLRDILLLKAFPRTPL